jgi:DNA polymerase elongation subunit (family B)
MPASLYQNAVSISKADELSSLKIARDQFLDPALKKLVAGKIANGDEILFLGNDIAETRRKEGYQLIIHGIFPCGSKATLTINGIDPFVDVRLLPDETDAEARSRVGRLIDSCEDIFSTSIQFKNGKDFLYYSHVESRYARVHFRSLQARSEFISVCREMNIKTYSNDKSTYYRVVSRGYEINLSGWNVIHGYHIANSSSKAAYSLSIDVSDITSIGDDKELARIAVDQGFDASVVKYENMIICGFDIEMIPFKAGCFPDADKNPKDSIFMICMTYHFVKRKESLLSVCLTLKEADPLDDVLMVYCRSEASLLAAFARFMSFMQPDFITEFNGGGFDWRNVITKARVCGVLPTFLDDMSIVKLARWELNPSMLTRYHRECRIKIGGATADAICKGLKMQGFVAFDTLVVFKQLEPNADSHKLDECLKRCNLGGKDELKIEEMFRIYRHGTSAEMKMVAHYCYIDTFKLQQLLIKKNVVQDRREVANLSYTSLHDNFYFAGGGRMRNLLMNRGAKLGYFFDTEYRPEVEDPDAKFPGAYVVPPVKGIVKPMLRFDEFVQLNNIEIDEDALSAGYEFISEHFDQMYHSDTCESINPTTDAMAQYVEYASRSKNQYPVSGLDYASLYPSIIMAYNISPERLIIDETYARELMAQGVNLQHVSFPFCGKMMRSWFVRHNNNPDEYSICGKLLIELFDRRAAIKKVLKHYGESIFEMEQEMKPFIERNHLEEYPRLAEYEETRFDYVSYDSKQKAVKIFMNTLYGEMGNTISCICAVQVAGSVTAMGRHNLKLAKQFVEEKLEMCTYYGDSVVGDTPIMISRIVDGKSSKDLVPIEELDTLYTMYNDGKEWIDYSDKNVYVMTEDGYSKILKVIRHRTNKKLYRVTTHIGSVIVTEDHSLLNADKEKIKPQDCTVGTSLLHWQPEPLDQLIDIQSDIIEDLSPEEALSYVKGFIYGGGRCDADTPFTLSNILSLMEEWQSEFYSSRGHKKVPQNVLNGDRRIKLAFMQGYFVAAGNTFNDMHCEGQIGSQGLYLLLLDLGYKVSVCVDGDMVYRLTFTHDKYRCDDITAIKFIEEMGECSGYVYDLETESHHFAAGVGQMVVHNTDSLYVSCNPRHFVDHDREYFTGAIDKLAYGTRLVETTFEQIEIAKTAVNLHLIEDNGSKFLKMAYEEVLYPCAFLSKKKYYGVPHEENVDFYPRKLFLRGLEIVKRGASDVLKDVINEVLLEVMDIKTTRDLMDIVKQAISRVFNTNWPLSAFAKTKSYRPDKKNISVQTMIRRYREMNYHTIPAPNVRFKYVICKYYPWTYDIEGRQKKITIGDCMELLERVVEEGLEIDLEYYFDNELTGQFARLITFCDEVYVPPVADEEVNTTGMTDIEIDVINKEMYTRSEDALFKSAKKYIGQMAKHYSKAYVNKGSLFANTWREVCGYIRTHPELLAKHLTTVQSIIVEVFASSTGMIRQDLFTWITHHIAKRYRTTVDDEHAGVLTNEIIKIEEYINDNQLAGSLIGIVAEWKRRVVEHIRSEYDYEYICKSNLAISTIWDVLTQDELHLILTDPAYFPAIDVDHAMVIVDMISSAVSKALPCDQLSLP